MRGRRNNSLNRLILVIVLLNGIIAIGSAALIMTITHITLSGRGIFGFSDLGLIAIIAMASVLTAFKMGDLYILMYNIIASLLKGREIEVIYRL